MKRLTPYLRLILLAAAMVFCQPLAVFAADRFTLTSDGQKVFTYGFPLQIVSCAEHVPLHMTAWETTLRFLGNFAIVFASGTLILHPRGRARVPRWQQSPG